MSVILTAARGSVGRNKKRAKSAKPKKKRTESPTQQASGGTVAGDCVKCWEFKLPYEESRKVMFRADSGQCWVNGTKIPECFDFDRDSDEGYAEMNFVIDSNKAKISRKRINGRPGDYELTINGYTIPQL